MPTFIRSSVLCGGACSDPRLTAHIASLGPPACDRGSARVPIRTALVVFAIVRLAGDAANAERLTGGGAFPIDGGGLRAVAKIHQVGVAGKNGGFGGNPGGQGARPPPLN